MTSCCGSGWGLQAGVCAGACRDAVVGARGMGGLPVGCCCCGCLYCCVGSCCCCVCFKCCSCCCCCCCVCFNCCCCCCWARTSAGEGGHGCSGSFCGVVGTQGTDSGAAPGGCSVGCLTTSVTLNRPFL